MPGLVLLAVLALADETELHVSYISDSSTDRQPTQTAFPKYPSIARRDRIEGEATVCFKINARGKVKRVSVKDYSHRIFRKPALRAIKKSSFEPLRPDQILATAKACRTYRFRLDPVVAEETNQ
jgi:TonB family protein